MHIALHIACVKLSNCIKLSLILSLAKIIFGFVIVVLKIQLKYITQKFASFGERIMIMDFLISYIFYNHIFHRQSSHKQ